MKSCTLQWLLVAAALTVFTVLALAGRWTDLGLAMIVTAIVWYEVVPELESRGQ